MSENKKTIVLGASPNPDRYAYKAVGLLAKNGQTVIPVGIKPGTIHNIEIDCTKSMHSNVHTISIYLNPEHQKLWYSYILSVQPTRLIFNPGSENPELQNLARAHGIHTEEACTLVLLQTGQF